MSDEARLASGKRFAEDLRLLREARGLSIDELHRETKIPRHLITSFEATSLFEHPMFNRVYLRSFVRTYAERVRAPQEAVLEALEAALEGRYDGGLAARIREGAEGAAAEEKTADASRPAAEETAEAAGRAVPDEPPAPPEEPAGEAWSAQSPPSGASGAAEAARRRAKNQPRTSSRSNALLLRVGAALAALALVAAVLIAFWPSGEDDRAAAPTADDTASAAVAETTANAAPPPRAEIGAMMDFVIVGAGGPVQGIRLTRDGDVRRPYWIEEGAATDFPAEERILVEEDAQIAKTRLLLEGYPFPKDRRDAQGRIRIDRRTAQAFLDTVRGAPVQLAAAPDTNRIPIPR